MCTLEYFHLRYFSRSLIFQRFDFVSGYLLMILSVVSRDAHVAVTDSCRSQIRGLGKAGPLQLPRSDDPSPPH